MMSGKTPSALNTSAVDDDDDDDDGNVDDVSVPLDGDAGVPNNGNPMSRISKKAVLLPRCRSLAVLR